MKKILKAIVFVTISLSLNAQVKTKSYFQGVPNERKNSVGINSKSLVIKAPLELELLKSKP